MILTKFDWEKAGKEYVEQMPNKLKESLIKGIEEAMLKAEEHAKKGFGSGKGAPNSPPGPLIARTGHLRRGIESGVNEGDYIGYLKNKVKYGEYHELGTKGMPARPFLRPAIINNIDELNRIIKDNIIRGLK